MSYLPQVGAVWLELVSPGVNLTCQENKERAGEGEVKSWERQSEVTQGSQVAMRKEGVLMSIPMPIPSTPGTALGAQPRVTPEQCDPRCASLRSARLCVNFLLPGHVEISAEIESNH